MPKTKTEKNKTLSAKPDRVPSPLPKTRAMQGVDQNAKLYPLMAQIMQCIGRGDMVYWLVSDNETVSCNTNAHLSALEKEQTFTKASLDEVCPSFYTYLLHNLKTNMWNSVPKIKVLWDHLHRPGYCIEKAANCEQYLVELLAVDTIDEKEKIVKGQFNGYTLNFKSNMDTLDFKTGKDIHVTYGVLVEDIDIYDINYKFGEFKLSYLEYSYPGFTERVKLALSIGLSPQEVAIYASDYTTTAGNKNADASDELPSLAFG